MIEEWEENLNCHAERMYIEVEDRRVLVPDPGQTHGKLTQFKHTLYLYWSMK